VIPGTIVAAGLAMRDTGVQAETPGYTAIASLPYTISTSGIYCLTHDLEHASSVARDAIRIEADDVVLDLNGHKVDGSVGGEGAFTFGIYAFGRRNITIRNGTVRGFFYGIYLDDFHPPEASAGHLVEAIRADCNNAIGIAMVGRGSVVRANHVLDTGGTTAFSSADAWGWGIYVVGAGNRVVDNDIDTVMKRGDGVATGIFLRGATDTLVADNRIVSADQGLLFEVDSSGKYRDNLTSAVPVPFTGGTDAGNNN
jgi:hypothetical protein